jgi:hypothetical protein
MAGRRRRPWPSTLAAAGLAVALAACTAEAPAGRAVGSTAAPPAPTTVASTRPSGRLASRSARPVGAFVRTCESSVYGDLGDGWRKRSVVVGPLAFVALRYAATQPAVDFRRRGGRYQGLKALAVVKAGATVTLTVPAAERRHLSLLYDPAAWKENNQYRIADGDTAVTFRSCPPAQTPLGADGTQFNGGFLVAGPRCATLEVSTPRWRTPRRVAVSFGAGRCRG